MALIKKYLPLVFLILGIILYFIKYIAIFPVLVLAPIACLSFFERTRIFGTIFFIFFIIAIAFISMMYFSEVEKMNDPMTSADEQKIREYIKQRSEMKEACDGMWYQRDLAGSMSDQEIINQCRPMGYDVYSKSWKYEPEDVKEVLRQYGIYD